MVYYTGNTSLAQVWYKNRTCNQQQQDFHAQQGKNSGESDTKICQERREPKPEE